MRARRRAACEVATSVALLTVGMSTLSAQQARAPVVAPVATTSMDAPTARFLARARAGTARYRSQEAAIADGYKRVGVEFPAMGEHWVHLGRVLEDSLIAERPAILIYVNVEGKPVFAGVAYTDVLQPGEPRPSFPAPGGWHEHNGSVDEESFPLAHGAMAEGTHSMGMSSTGGDPEVRLSVLHAWVGVANPAGAFVTDNWALPLARLQLAAPPATSSATPSRDALRALSLASDDEGYLLLTLRMALDLTPSEEALADKVIARQRIAAAREAASVKAARGLTPASSARLVALWSATWEELARALPSRAARLRALRRELG